MVSRDHNATNGECHGDKIRYRVFLLVNLGLRVYNNDDDADRVWSSTPCELTCSAGKTETGFKAHLVRLGVVLV